MVDRDPVFGEAMNFSGGYILGSGGKHALETEDVGIALKELPRRSDADAHYHSEGTEIVIVTKGELALVFHEPNENGGDGCVWGKVVKEGEFVIIPPGLPHENPYNAKDTEVVVVIFPNHPGDKITMLSR